MHRRKERRLPSELPLIIRTLDSRKTIPVHNGKFALANHQWDEPRKFMQVVVGPRQVGKSTVVKQVFQDLTIPS